MSENKEGKSFYQKFKESQKRAKQQFAVQRKKVQNDVDELTAEQKKAVEFRASAEETDYSIFNYIMTVHDFKDCTELLEMARKFYKLMYVHLINLQRQNEELKDIVSQNRDKFSRPELKLLDKHLGTKSPFLMAREALEEIQKRAQERSRKSNKGVPIYGEDEAKKMGIDVRGDDS